LIFWLKIFGFLLKIFLHAVFGPFFHFLNSCYKKSLLKKGAFVAAKKYCYQFLSKGMNQLLESDYACTCKIFRNHTGALLGQPIQRGSSSSRIKNTFSLDFYFASLP